MRQVLQNLRSGELSVVEVPAPSLREGGVLVRTRASLISVGTEKMLIDLGRKSLAGKARARPDLVKKVLAKVRTEGFLATLRSVMGRLSSSLPLGYSAVGEVVRVGRGLEGVYRPGDRVACAGAGYANHAEYLFVPGNLTVPMPAGVPDREGAFVTLGAIALQGVRVADPRLGEVIGVIGLGLLGQITVQLLVAAGCRVLALDLDEGRVARAREAGAEAGGVPGVDDPVALAEAMTGGHGLDAVIVAAATKSNAPVALAGDLLRKKGRVSIVGAVGMEVPRDSYYRKELDLRLSCSYGPGRYDPAYEEKGQDYPYGYVRWTEQRNMDSFLRLANDGRMDLASLITHEYGIADAEKAYSLIDEGEGASYLGILLEYPEERPIERRVEVPEARAPGTAGDVRLGVIGAGNFAKAVLLPELKNVEGASIRAVSTSGGVSAHDVAKRFGAPIAASDPAVILDDDQVDAVLVATRHDSHASLVSACLEKGKPVFVEKPLAIDEAGLAEVVAAHEKSPGLVQVGFNRRFSPHAEAMRAHFPRDGGPVVAHFRVNAGAIPMDTWIQDPEVGGGRIIGEGCHFLDVLRFVIGEDPVRVHAEATAPDTVVATLRYPGGSVGSLVYAATGDGSLSKERVEVFGGGRAAVLEDWRVLFLHGGGRAKKLGGRQQKGFREELEAFVRAVKRGEASPIPFAESVRTTEATFAILESLRTGLPVEIGEPDA
jgi:predicted dehydrogenase/threonine dehydrogenase-like Zn-dependent dehydrogenase